jgi:RPA family protein
MIKQQFTFKREPAVRIFAHELSRTAMQSEKEENRKSDRFAPTYSFSQTGARINRVFMCGALTEVDEIDTQNTSFVKGRLVDPTGAINIMAGQYQPEVAAILRQLSDKIPIFAAVVGKLNIYKPQDGGCYVSIRPEDLHVVTREIVDTWIGETAKCTIERIKTLKELMTAGKYTEEQKAVISIYNPQIDELKRMVRIAIGKEASNDYKPPGMNDGDGGVKKPATASNEQPKTSASPPVISPAAQNSTQEIKESKIEAGYNLLKELCSLSEDGTVGGNAFADRLVQRKLASPDTAMTLIKGMMDGGMAYEARMGRLKAVSTTSR